MFIVENQTGEDARKKSVAFEYCAKLFEREAERKETFDLNMFNIQVKHKKPLV